MKRSLRGYRQCDKLCYYEPGRKLVTFHVKLNLNQLNSRFIRLPRFTVKLKKLNFDYFQQYEYNAATHMLTLIKVAEAINSPTGIAIIYRYNNYTEPSV